MTLSIYGKHITIETVLEKAICGTQNTMFTSHELQEIIAYVKENNFIE